jgi:tRNA(Phe) wybutosine-synthesizing methylase Tyw3
MSTKPKVLSKSKESKVSFKVYSGRLDESIVPLLEHLNAMGIKTTMSCSGVNRDHDGKKNIANKRGYIFIDFIEPSSKRLVNKVKRAAAKAGLNYHSAPSFWPLIAQRVDYTSLDDAERERVWRVFFEELQR